METSDVVEIPSCEICKKKYSAKMKVGNKKICHKLLIEKIKALRFLQVLATIFYVVGFIAALFIILYSVISIFAVAEHDFVFELFAHFLFPIKFSQMAFKHFEKRKRIAEEAVVQIVEVTLIPVSYTHLTLPTKA